MDTAQISLIATALCLSLYALVGIIRVFRRRSSGAVVGSMSAVMAAGVPFGTVAFTAARGTRAVTIPPEALTAAVGLIAIGFVLMLLEGRMRRRGAHSTLGRLGFFTGIIAAVFVVAAPRVSANVLPPGLLPNTDTERLSIERIDYSSQAQATAIPANIMVSTPVPAATRLQTTPTPSPTPFVYRVASGQAERTQADAPVEAASTTRQPGAVPVTTSVLCRAQVEYNLNLRSLPDPDGTLVTTIPFGTRIEVSGTDASGLWLATTHDERSGWVNDAYVTLGSGCDELPVVE